MTITRREIMATYNIDTVIETTDITPHVGALLMQAALEAGTDPPYGARGVRLSRVWQYLPEDARDEIEYAVRYELGEEAN